MKVIATVSIELDCILDGRAEWEAFATEIEDEIEQLENVVKVEVELND